MCAVDAHGGNRPTAHVGRGRGRGRRTRPGPTRIGARPAPHVFLPDISDLHVVVHARHEANVRMTQTEMAAATPRKQNSLAVHCDARRSR
jgi:hypothetical protein